MQNFFSMHYITKTSEELCTTNQHFGCISLYMFLLILIFLGFFTTKNQCKLPKNNYEYFLLTRIFFQFKILVYLFFTAAFFAKIVTPSKICQVTVHVKSLFHQCTINVVEFVFFIFFRLLFRQFINY